MRLVRNICCSLTKWRQLSFRFFIISEWFITASTGSTWHGRPIFPVFSFLWWGKILYFLKKHRQRDRGNHTKNNTKPPCLHFFSGLGYIVGSETAKALGQWQWALRVTPILGVIAVLLIFFVLKDPERGQSEGSSHIQTTPWTEDMKDLVKK